MRRSIVRLLCVVLVTASVPALALNSGNDVLVPAAARAGSWVTDLYIMNPGTSTVNGTIYWLERGQANPSPADTATFTLAAGETLVLEDVIFDTFGFGTGTGAFRIVADGMVVANCRIYSLVDGDTFGQGFEGVPASAATTASTDIVGMGSNAGFRTNFYALAGADGASLSLSLLDPTGAVLANTTYELGVYQPVLDNVTTFYATNYDDGTLHVDVTAGAAVVGASKVDENTGDPTTLESWVVGGGETSADGIYQFAIYDSESYATGGNVVVAGGMVTSFNGTYTNWDKMTGGVSDCTMIFRFGSAFDPTVALSEFAQGVTWTDSYLDSGDLTWTVQFDVIGNMALAGTIDAEGSVFPAEDIGCDGVFPTLTLAGGKTN